MLNDIIRFEWRYHARQVSFLAAAAIFFFLGFSLSVLRFGADNVAINSPYLVMEIFALLSLISVIVVGVFASNAVLRDDEHRMSEIIHSTPVGRFPHLFGRFAGAFLATLTTAAFSALGMVAGLFTPWMEPHRVAAMDARPFLAAFAVITIPNVLFATAIVFAMAVLTRNAIATYASAIAIYILYFVCAALTDSPLMAQSRPGGGGGPLGALLDPFGLTAFFDVTRFWTAAAKNTRFVPLTGVLLANRLIAIGAAAAVWAFVYRRFSFRVQVERRTLSAPKKSRRAESLPLHVSNPYFSAVAVELRSLATKTSLLLLLLWAGLAVSEIYGDVLTGEYRSMSYPATSLILEALRQPLSLIGTLLIIYFGAEIFWREQRFGIASIIDSTPVSNALMITTKLTALATLIAVVILGGIAAGVALQIAHGYYRFEPALYLSLFYFTGLPLLLFAAASLVIHAASPGKYAGMIFVLLFAIFTSRASAFGLEHPLWRFGRAPGAEYTEMNGFGDASPFHWFMLHWSAWALLFLAIAAVMWRRIGAPLKERIRLLARSRRMVTAMIVFVLVTGGWIFYNTNIAHAYVTSSAMSDWKADYEKTYKRFEHMPRPSLRAIEGRVNLYPDERRYRVAGHYTIVNETARPIDSVFVAVRREARINALSMKNARIVAHDPRFGMVRFAFTRPLAPGERAELHFDLDYERGGFGSDDPVLENGTFLLSLRSFPTLGYRRSYELPDPRERRKRGLPAAGVELEEDGSHGAVVGSEEEWVDFGMTVSTSRDQIAIAPGRLEKTWERGGRRWFRYRAESPILSRFAITSARYAVAKRQHGRIAIELYHHPAHATNVPHMLDVAAASLDVMEKLVAPYPARQLRIVEIPGTFPYAGFALPEVVYVREDRAFLTDARDPSRPDLIGRRLAHEVAHQWFGHRIIPATTEGGTVIVESLTKYAELRILERMHGRGHVQQLLEIELDRYLSGRAAEEFAEKPLYKSDRESYLFYAKGAIVLYAIRDLIGEEAADRAIRELLKIPRPTSIDLARNLRAAACGGQARLPVPDRQECLSSTNAALIDQWLKEIVLYDFRLDSATARRRPDGRYDVSLRIAAAKFRADGQGNEVAIPLDEPIGIAVGDQSRKVSLRSGVNDISLIVNAPPQSATVDPWITRIDRNPRDNSRAVTR